MQSDKKRARAAENQLARCRQARRREWNGSLSFCVFVSGLVSGLITLSARELKQLLRASAPAAFGWLAGRKIACCLKLINPLLCVCVCAAAAAELLQMHFLLLAGSAKFKFFL